jgi:hypothetical protein
VAATVAVGFALTGGAPTGGAAPAGSAPTSTPARQDAVALPGVSLPEVTVAPGASGSTGSGDTGSAADPDTASSDTGVGRVGQAVRDQGIQVTVTTARYADSVDVGNEYSGYKPTPAGADAKYVVVEGKVLNDTAKSISPGCGGGLSTAVLDDRDRRYDTPRRVR